MRSRHLPPKQSPYKQRGLALIAVLWLVAVLSLIVTGVLSSVRGEVRMTTQRKDAVQAAAWGDAALVLALQNLLANNFSSADRPQTLSYTFAGQTLSVTVTPANGWIDLSRAPPSLLTDLFQYAAGVAPGPAEAMAQAVVDWRSQGATGATPRLDAVQSLAALPAIPFDVYAKIQSLVTVYGGSASAGKVNPLAAPRAVLNVLAQGNPQSLAALVSAQVASSSTLDMTLINPQHAQVSSDTRFRLSVNVGAYQRRWWVRMGGSSGPLPWQLLMRETVASAGAD